MSADEILSQAIKQGVVLYLEENQLKYKAEVGTFSNDLKILVKENKVEIVEHLKKINENKTINVLPPIRKRDPNQAIPLSYSQQRLWFVEQLEGETVQYNMPGRFLIHGKLNLTAFEKALKSLLDRHEVLRTNFKSVGGETFQVVSEHYELPFKYFDLSQLERDEIKPSIDKHNSAECDTPFNLSNDLMLRIRVLKISEAEHLVLFTMHHIASDGWSMGIFNKEFAQLYDAYASNLCSPLKALETQYGDYSIWQRDWLKGDNLNAQLDYWKTQLKELPVVHQLPLDYPRPLKQSYLGKRRRTVLSNELSADIHEQCRENKVTLFMFLHSVFSVTLSRWSNSSDIVMGTPISGRTHKDTEGLIGFFINTLVLRSRTNGSDDFRQLLQSNKRMILDSYAHQYVPFEMLVDELSPERDLGINPLVQISFVVQNNEDVSFELEEKEIDSVAQSRGVANRERISIKYELALYVDDRNGKISLTWVYNDSIFEESTVIALIESFEALLEDVLIKLKKDNLLEINIKTLALIKEENEGEKPKTLIDNTTTQQKIPCLLDLFSKQADTRPNAIAISSGINQISYCELDRRVNLLANHLQNQGIKEDSLIGICLERSIETVSLIFALWRLGASYIALDPELPPERLSDMILDSNAIFIVTKNKHKDLFNNKDNLSLIFLDGEDFKFSSVENSSIRKVPANPDRLAYVVYTSGSGGKPKGVMTRISGINNYLSYLREHVDIGIDDRVLQLASLSFDASVRDLICPIVCGAQAILLENNKHKDTLHILDILKKSKVTSILSIVPSYLKILIADPPKSTLRDMRLVLVSGEVLTNKLCRDTIQAINPELHIINQYGPTECTMTTTFYHYRESNNSMINLPIGKPINGAKIHLLDGNFQKVPRGAIGEIFISGSGVSLGYLNNKSLTTKSFYKLNIDNQEVRCYRTGDLARYRSDDNLEFLGRSDDQIKIRGHRVEIEEVKNVALSSGIVDDVVILSRTESTSGTQIIAFVVLSASESNLSTSHNNEQSFNAKNNLGSELNQFLSDRLPSYMVPSFFVHIEKIPLTANGKVDRRALLAMEFTSSNTSDKLLPSSETERGLLKIWSEVLKLSPDCIGADESFFNIGGHSLLAIIVVGKIKNELGVTIELASVFEHQSIRSLASHINKLKTGKDIDQRKIQRIDQASADSGGASMEEFDL